MADVVCNERLPSVQDDLVDGIRSREQKRDRPHPLLVNCTLTYTVFTAAGQHTLCFATKFFGPPTVSLNINWIYQSGLVRFHGFKTLKKIAYNFGVFPSGDSCASVVRRWRCWQHTTVWLVKTCRRRGFRLKTCHGETMERIVQESGGMESIGICLRVQSALNTFNQVSGDAGDVTGGGGGK